MAGFSQQTLSDGWSFKRTDDESAEAWMPVASIPSVVHQDLEANKKLSDPFIGLDELKAEWVGEKRWTYKTTFKKPAVPAGSSIALAFDGLDTFANVRLNGKTILESDNMFLSHRVDITTAIAVDNILEIEFDSALLRAREIKEGYPDHVWVGFNGEMARLGVRKSQYHWGWDWGPVLMTAGVWRPVRLEAFTARVSDLRTDTQLADDHQSARVSAFAQVEAFSTSSCNATFALRHEGKVVSQQTIPAGYHGLAKVEFDVEKPSLWFPHGYGSQALYEISVSISNGNEELHQVSKRFGIRKVDLIQDVDKHGKSFYFRVNGVDVFCGGSCWIPADNYLPRISPEKYRKWMELMVAGNQVMVRVWGGGIYEDDSFYDACDELGVMVWQDFMFGCGNYPTWPALLESVRKEAVCNLRRLRHHPSIVIYAGNNEDYQVQEQSGLTYNYEDKNQDNWLKSDFPARYIYEEILPTAVRQECPDVYYHPGSPWGDGKPTADPTVGDMHQWNVWHGTQEKYQIFETLGGRFNSEFGMEAFPHVQTIDYFVENEADKFPQSHVLDFHNKADGHERRIATYLVENLRTATGLTAYIHLTQLIQAEAMMFGYRGWRRQFGDERHCGGALLWQLDDCWPTTSWAIVDYFLRRKAAYYAVARVLAPVAIGVQREHHDWSISHARPAKTSKYELWLVSSLQKEVTVKVELKFISVATGLEILDPIVREDVRVLASGTTNIITDGVIDHITTPEPHVLAARVWIDGRLVARDMDWPQPLKYLNFADRGLEITNKGETEEGKQTLVVSVKKPVKCLVFEEREGVMLSDSAIDVAPGDDQTITITGLKAGDEPLTWRYLDQDLN
ncbi:hypothetical protein FQN54_003894 [Arachnomyces sp. PD_36]|nr:hypothetical protein FQN54_003894 [Arachnomyces sp. PD_36]